MCCSRRCEEGLADKGLHGGGERGQGMGVERAEELAGGDGDVPGEGFHAGFSGKNGVGTKGLAKALDGGGGEGGGDGGALGMMANVVVQELLL